jgi:RNA polymerase sigma factor for flagellar operon FliA
MDSEELKDWEAYRAHGDRAAHARLCERYLPVVARIVNRMAIYLGSGVLDKKDLVQAGVIGLIGAIERFDLTQNKAFIDFAAKRIRGAVWDECRSLDGYSSRMRRQQKQIERLRELLKQKFYHEPTEEEMAAELGMPLEKFRAMQNNSQVIRQEKLDWAREQEYYQQPGLPLAQSSVPGADGLSNREKMQLVASYLEELPMKTKQVLGLYYREGLTLKEIAQVMGLTESRICQMHAAAIEWLQQGLVELSGGLAGAWEKRPREQEHA